MRKSIYAMFTLFCLTLLAVSPLQAQEETPGIQEISPSDLAPKTPSGYERGDVSVHISMERLRKSVAATAANTPEFDTLLKMWTDEMGKEVGREVERGNAPDKTLRLMLAELRYLSGMRDPTPVDLFKTFFAEIDSAHIEMFQRDVDIDEETNRRRRRGPMQIYSIVVKVDPVDLFYEFYPVFEGEMQDMLKEDEGIDLRERVQKKKSPEGIDYVEIKPEYNDDIQEFYDDRPSFYIAGTELDKDGLHVIVLGEDKERVLDSAKVYKKSGSSVIKAYASNAMVSVDLRGQLLNDAPGLSNMLENLGYKTDNFIKNARVYVNVREGMTTARVLIEPGSPDDIMALETALSGVIMMGKLSQFAMQDADENMLFAYQLLAKVRVGTTKQHVTLSVTANDEETVTLILKALELIESSING